MAHAELIDCGDGFLSIRGHFKAGGLIDVGTQAALVELEPGRFVFLDSYTLDDEALRRILAMTGNGEQVEAIINLHPFHTLHCRWMHETFPKAKLFGTQRHHDKLPDLPWESDRCEAAELHARYDQWVDFSIPDGVLLVCDSESVHFSSILARHRRSGTIHVDDTLSFIDKGFPLSLLPITGQLNFHPTLAKALKPEAGAADRFAHWARTLARDWSNAKRVACAHNAIVPLRNGEFTRRVLLALERVKPVLDKHRAQFG